MDSRTTLNQLDTLLLLALSGCTNLVISSPPSASNNRASSTALQQYILSFCERSSIHRRAHVVFPSFSVEQRADSSSEELLKAAFVDVKAREVPQVLVVPGLDEYVGTAQRALYEMVRDERFTLFKETHNLPRRFVLIGIAQDYAGLSNHLLDIFGLSLSLASPWTVSSIPESKMIPPLIPATPPLYAHPKITTYISDLLSATRHYPILHSQYFTYRCSAKNILAICNLWVKLQEALQQQKQGESLVYSEKGEIRPDDVRDIYASCVMHLLRYRAEKDRLSAVWDYKGTSREGDATHAQNGGQADDGKQDQAATKRPENTAEELLPSFEAILEQIIATV